MARNAILVSQTLVSMLIMASLTLGNCSLRAMAMASLSELHEVFRLFSLLSI